jgi:mannose-6-phosphate isomerase-like protein (cupin superfamily)
MEANKGYHVVDTADVEPMDGRSAEARPVGEAAGLDRRNDKLGIRVYTAAPGEQIPGMYHYHDEQVEVFFVLDGTLHVETPDREYVVRPEQAFFVEPGHPHRAYNPEAAESAVRLLAIGAPSVEDHHAYDPEE